MKKVVKLPDQKRQKVTLTPGKANVFAAAKTNATSSSSFTDGIPMQAIHAQKLAISALNRYFGILIGLCRRVVGEAGVGDEVGNRQAILALLEHLNVFDHRV